MGPAPEGAASRIGKGSPAVLALSGDGANLAVGTNTGIYSFEAQSMQERWSLPSDKPVNALAFSPNGQLLVAGLDDGSLFLFNADTGEIVNSLRGGEAGVEALAWQTADDSGHQLLATGFNDGNMIISAIGQEPFTVEVVGDLDRSQTGVTVMAFSPNRRILVTGNRSGIIQFWDTDTMTYLGALEGHRARSPVRSLRWSSGGDYLYSGADDGNVIVWDIAGLEVSEVIEAHPEDVLAVGLSPDDLTLSSIGVDGSVKFWSSGDGGGVGAVPSEAGELTAAAISGDGGTFATVGESGEIQIWAGDRDTFTRRLSFEGFSQENIWAGAAAWSPDGERLAEGLWNQVLVWEPERGEILLRFEGHESAVTNLAWSPSGDKLASTSRDEQVIIWDADTGEILKTLDGHQAGVTDLAWSPDEERIATAGSTDNSVIVWNADTGQSLGSLFGPDEALWSVAWSPDGGTLAIGSNQGRVLLWDAESLPAIESDSFLAHLAWVTDLTWSPDGSKLASSGADGLAVVWDIAARERVATLVGHNNVVSAVEFNPTGELIGTSSVDQLVIIWEIDGPDKSPDPREIFSGHSDAIDSLSWSPDGALLTSASRDGTMIFWNVGGETDS